MKPPIRFYGGKHYQIDWILEVFRQYNFHTYIEPFGGSGTILFAKPPSKVEVYNDLNSNLVNMYRVIRNPDTLKEFAEFVENSPYARETFNESCKILQENKSLTDVERAGHFFIVIRQSFSGCQRSWSMIGEIGKRQAHPYRFAIDRLPEIHARLRYVHIENIDAIECITRYASDIRTTLIYCDPPYVADTRTDPDIYSHEMTDEQHGQLVQTLLTLPGHRILSGYKSPIYQPLLDAGWTCLEKEFVCRASPNKVKRTECLYCSPNNKPKANMNFSTINKVIQVNDSCENDQENDE